MAEPIREGRPNFFTDPQGWALHRDYFENGILYKWDENIQDYYEAGVKYDPNLPSPGDPDYNPYPRGGATDIGADITAAEDASKKEEKKKKEEEEAKAKEGLGVPIRWDVVSKGGWDFHVGYDKFGNIVSQEKLGETREKGKPKGESYRETDKYGQEWDVTVDPNGNITKRKIAPPKPEKPEGLWVTREEAQAAAGTSGYIPVQYSNGYWGLQAPPKPPAEDKGIPQPSGEVPTDQYGRKATWDADDGEWRYPPDWNVDPKGEERSAAERAAKEAEDKRRYEADAAEAKRQYEAEQKRQSDEAAFRQQQATQSSDQFWRQFDYQQQQDAARRQAEKEARLANLRASPASWLQYSLEANQTPVIQPWQKPLMPQQYGNLNVGQPIPGWQGQLNMTNCGSTPGMPNISPDLAMA